MYRHPHSSWCCKDAETGQKLDTLLEWCLLSFPKRTLRPNRAVAYANKPNKLLLVLWGTNSNLVYIWHMLSCCHTRTANISHDLHFSHLVMTGLWECALMFFSMIKKLEKEFSTLFIEAAVYSMMDVLFTLRKGECNWLVCYRKKTQFNWI